MFERGLIVSSQAQPVSPRYGRPFMAALARAAQQGGAAGIRANEPQQLGGVRRVTSLPNIGIFIANPRAITRRFTAALPGSS